MRYRPTRAAKNNGAVENEDGPRDGDRAEGAADATSTEDDPGYISEDGEGGEKADAAQAVAAATTGLGESMVAFFQRGTRGAASYASGCSLVLRSIADRSSPRELHAPMSSHIDPHRVWSRQ